MRIFNEKPVLLRKYFASFTRIKMKKSYKSVIIAALLGLVCACSCADNNYYKLRGYAQGGEYGITYKGASIPPEKVKEGADSLLREIDLTLSGYNKGSLLSRLNRGEKVVITPMFARLYRESMQMWEQSGGAFDPASGALYDIWGFGFTSDSLPSQKKIESVLRQCGMGRLVDADTIDSWCKEGKEVTAADLLKTPGGPAPELNFNAIAQGFSCDLVYEYLKGLGVTDMLVDIGEIRCCGLNPGGKGWSIGIDNPVDGNNSPGEDIRDIWDSNGRDCGIVTSGNYRKFYIKDGVKYSHTIDPRTGYPVTHSLLSATVVADSASEADALATYFMVIGDKAAQEYLSRRPELKACLISSDGVWKSPGF